MVLMPDQPSWAVEGRDWPNRAHSRFVAAGGLTWHVQEMGKGPSLLLLHGTGAATHSFRDLAPLLARHFHVLMLDLPGHGFTGMPDRHGLSLPGMARLVRDLLASLEFRPDIVVGHSAGVAILIEMALAGMNAPKVIISINGALLPIRGATLFAPLAKLLFLNPIAPRLFAWRALGPDSTRRLLHGTGSAVDDRGIELYQRLFRRSGHIAGTLGMMANWDLDRFERRLGKLVVPLVLVTASGDRAVPPADAKVIAARVPGARIVALDHGGHLVHEEKPAELSDLIIGLAGAGISASGRS